MIYVVKLLKYIELEILIEALLVLYYESQKRFLFDILTLNSKSESYCLLITKFSSTQIKSW